MRGTKNLPTAVLIALFLIFSTAAADVNDPVAHWKFDEGAGDTAYDSAGTNDGAVHGPTWVPGILGGALDFNGISDGVEVPDDNALNPSTQITIAFWLYNRGGQNAGLFKYTACPDESPSYSRAYKLMVLEDTQQVQFWATDSAASGSGDKLESTGIVPHNQWYHIAATFDEGFVTTYIDGQADSSGTISVTSIMNDDHPLTIGGYWSYCGTKHWVPRCDGLIDDVRIYNRALSEEAIWALANPQIPVAVDIKPGACPNPLNLKSRGVVPVAVLGTEDFDVNSIDLASIRLEGVAAIRSSYEDVAAPLADGNECDCTDEGPDGYTDLTLKFRTQQIAAALLPEFADLEKNDVVPLILTGTLTDGTPIEGIDCVVIKGTFRDELIAARADINDDGHVDILDFAALAQSWLENADIY